MKQETSNLCFRILTGTVDQFKMAPANKNHHQEQYADERVLKMSILISGCVQRNPLKNTLPSLCDYSGYDTSPSLASHYSKDNFLELLRPE